MKRTLFLLLALTFVSVVFLTGCDILFGPSGPTKYPVTYYANGGSGSLPPTASYEPGSDVRVASKPSTLVKTGHTFAGWSGFVGPTEFTFQPGEFFTMPSSRVDLDAVWEPVATTTYTVTFNADGGSPATQTATVTSPSTTVATLPTAPTKTDHTFDGWYTQIGGDGIPFTTSTVVTGNITVYAKWLEVVPIIYTVTFDADGGSPDTQTVLVTSPSTTVTNLPDNPTKADHTFDGWYTAINGGGTQFTTATPVTGNITVFAKWLAVAPTIYTVTYNADGGSPDMQTATVTSPSTTVAALPTAPTKADHTFDGWYTAINGGGTQFTTATPVTGNITVFAKWLAVAPTIYTVTFNADGGSPDTQTVLVTSPSTTVTNLPDNPTKADHTFDGWYTALDGGGTQFTTATVVAGNITVFAKWLEVVPIIYTVTFDADGGSPDTQTVLVTSPSTTVTNLPDNPTKADHTFDGWYTALDGGGTQFTTATVVAGNITVFAKWLAVAPTIYTVSFNNNGGSGTMSAQSGATGTVITLTANTFTRTGYTFQGWATSAGGTVAYENGASYTIGSGNATLYAVWSINTYTITFHANDGSGVTTTQDATYGQTVYLNNPFTRENYTFQGWAVTPSTIVVDYLGGAEYVMGVGNLSFYAVWQYDSTSKYEDVDIGFGSDGENIDIGFGNDGESIDIGFGNDGEAVDIGF